MRKIIVILSLLLCVAFSAFAAEGQIGLTLGFQNFWYDQDDGPADMEERSLIITLDGANFFGENGGFGVEYGIGMSNVLNRKSGDLTVDSEEFHPDLALRLGLAYRYGFSDMFGIVAGLGASGHMSWHDDYMGWDKVTTMSISMYGKLALDITFGSIRIDAGVGVGGPVYSKAEISVGDVTRSGETDLSGIFATPYISLSYVY